jgi:peroxiredoxin Q/BCP
LAQLRQHYDEFVSRDAEILAIGPDIGSVFRLYWGRENIPFIGLPDPGHTVAEQYGQEVSMWKLGRMPALMIVDKKGRVRFTHYAENMRDYPTVPEMLQVLDGLRAKRKTARDKAA